MRTRAVWLTGLVAALLVACFLSPFASRGLDGLDRVAQDLGFRHRERAVPYLHAPLPDYKLPGLPNARWSGPAAGMVGVLVVFGLASGCGLLVRRRPRR